MLRERWSLRVLAYNGQRQNNIIVYLDKKIDIFSTKLEVMSLEDLSYSQYTYKIN